MIARTLGGLELRRPRDADVSALVESCRDEAIVRFCPSVPRPYGPADARDFVARARAPVADRRTWVIDEDGDLRGVIGVTRRGRSVGYWVAPAARGRGVASAALRLALDRVADVWSPSHVTLTTHLANHASRRVAVKAGFRLVGTVDQPPFRDGSTTAWLYELRLDVT